MSLFKREIREWTLTFSDTDSHPVFLPGYRIIMHKIGQPGLGVGIGV